MKSGPLLGSCLQLETSSSLLFPMITEDQLEQLAIQWFQDTGGENIEHRTLNIERRSEEMRSLAGGAFGTSALGIQGSEDSVRQPQVV